MECLTFVVYDSVEKELFIARDRYGIKPLYYGFFGSTFLFGSEQKAIESHIRCKDSFDYEALIEYFTFQNIFTNKTFHKDIKLFPAGHYARVSVDSTISQIKSSAILGFPL